MLRVTAAVADVLWAVARAAAPRPRGKCLEQRSARRSWRCLRRRVAHAHEDGARLHDHVRDAWPGVLDAIASLSGRHRALPSHARRAMLPRANDRQHLPDGFARDIHESLERTNFR